MIVRYWHKPTYFFLLLRFLYWTRTNIKFSNTNNNSPFSRTSFHCETTRIVTNLTCGLCHNGNHPTNITSVLTSTLMWISHFFSDLSINHLTHSDLDILQHKNKHRKLWHQYLKKQSQRLYVYRCVCKCAPFSVCV